MVKKCCSREPPGPQRMMPRPPRDTFTSTVAVFALAALVLVPVAGAHGTLTPAAAAAGVSQRFELVVPNDRVDADVVGVTLALPQGAVLESAEAAQPRWAVASGEASVRWTGGPIESSTTETFAFVARLAAESGPQEFTLVESYDDGDGAPFPLTVVATGAATGGSDGEGTVAAVALVLAALALVVSTIALALALRMRANEAA
jgi:uncharacterized protein YcnI